MRALVIGASGQVGAALCSRLIERGHEALGTHRTVPGPSTRVLDLADGPATERLIGERPLDWVFCPAALTHVDYCEDHPDEAFRLNRDAPALAARAAAKRGAGFVYYSSEYVFDGANGPYDEEASVNPISIYGQSKLEGEQRVREMNVRALVLRTTVVYGPEPQGKNFVYQLLRRARTGERMTVPRDQRSSPTYNRDLAAVSVELAERGLGGIFHVAGSEILDRYAFGLLACEVFGLDRMILEPVLTVDLRQRARRPLRAGLRTERVRAIIGTELRAPRDGLGAMRRALEAASSEGASE